VHASVHFVIMTVCVVSCDRE